MWGAKAPPKGGKMKINKRLLSFFLAVLMVFTTFGETVFAVSSNFQTKSEKPAAEIEGKVKGNKEIFTFDLKEIKKEEAPKLEKGIFPGVMLFSVPKQDRAADNYDTTVKVTTEGLNGAPFDWEALPNKEFKITANWETSDGKTHTKDLTPAITEAGTFNYTVGWPVDEFGNKEETPVEYEATHVLQIKIRGERKGRKFVSVTADKAGAKVTIEVFNGTNDHPTGEATIKEAGKFVKLTFDNYKLQSGDVLVLKGTATEDGKEFTSNPYKLIIK